MARGLLDEDHRLRIVNMLTPKVVWSEHDPQDKYYSFAFGPDSRPWRSAPLTAKFTF